MKSDCIGERQKLTFEDLVRMKQRFEELEIEALGGRNRIQELADFTGYSFEEVRQTLRTLALNGFI